MSDDAPSMAKAALIRDVAARHAYVFDNGLCSPDFFDLEKRMASEEFALLRKHVQPDHRTLEVGCFTGLNLLGLYKCGHEEALIGIDFVPGAVEWLRRHAVRSDGGFHPIAGIDGEFPDARVGDIHFPIAPCDRAICFDVLEHQLNVGKFLCDVRDHLTPDGRALFLVPEGANFNDCGHVAWFPNAECLRNVLDYYFDVIEVRRLETSAKLFAICQRRD